MGDKYKKCICPIPSCKHRILPANTRIYVCLYNVPKEISAIEYVESIRSDVEHDDTFGDYPAL